MQQINDVLNANIETLRKGALPYVYQKNKNFAVQRIMQNTDSYRITKTTNGLDFRAPIEFGPPGVFGAANLDGGALGLGTGFSISEFSQTYFDVKMAFQMSWLSTKGTSTSAQSVINVFQRTMTEGLPNMARYEDVSWHNLGGQDGQVGIGTTASNLTSTTATYTMDPDVGARLFIPLQRFEILNASGTWITQNYSPDNLPYVNAGGINYAARTIQITFPTGMTAPANGDVLYFQGATPAGVPTWLQGLRYVNTTATSGNYLGLSRTTYPTINSSAITSGGTLTPQMVLALRQLIMVRQGDAQALKVTGLIDPHQIAVMSASVQTLQTFYRSQVTEKQIDPLPEVTLEGGIVWGGVTHYYDGVQSSTRIDYCNSDDWGRVYIDDKPGADFYRRPGDNEMFFNSVATNGSPNSDLLFYLIATLNYYNVNPGNSGLITNLVSPSSDYTY